MKPKFRSLVTAFAPLSRSSLIVVTSLCSLASVQAQTQGTWTAAASGNWSDSANWADGIVASAGGDANFSTVDLPAAVQTVTLDVAQTIGSLNFADADTATPGTWTVSGANILTLAGATPTITTGVNATISSVVAGSSGLRKEGASNLTLGAANTFTGSVTVNAGNLILSSTNAYAGGTSINSGAILTLGVGTNFSTGGIGTGIVNFNGGSLDSTMGNNNTVIYGNVVNVDTGKVGTINAPNRFEMTGAVTGAGTLNFNVRSNTDRSDFRNNFVGFTGNLNFAGTGGIRLRINQSGAAYAAAGMANTKLDLAGSLWISSVTGSGGNTVSIGSLSGSSASASLRGGTAGAATYSIGALNLDTTFAGYIQNNGSIAAAITKVGTGKLSLNGANTYTGNTTVSAGILEFGEGGSIGTSNVSIASGATLQFNSSVEQTVVGIISGAGTLVKKGAGSLALNGVNTYTVGPVIEGGSLVIAANTALGNAANSITFSTGAGKLTSRVAGLEVPRAVSIGAGASGGFSALTSADSIAVSGVVSGDGNLAVSGEGLVSLSGDNSYLGSTAVSAGTLHLANTTGSATSSGAVSVTGGTLAGTGTAAGVVSISSGVTLRPGPVTSSSSSVGTLTTGALTLAGGSTIAAEFASASSHDKIAVNGDLSTLSASAGSPVIVDLRVENSVAKWSTLGTYDLIQYSGSFTGDANELFAVSEASKQGGLSYSFSAANGNITLTIAGDAPPEWNVDAGGDWSTAGNWVNGVPNSTGSSAIFGSVITSSATVTVDSPKTLGLIQFNNTNSYQLVGTSALSLDASSGNAEISVLAGNHEISAPLTLADSLGITMVSAEGVLTLSGDISGAGGLTHATQGTVLLTGQNTFAGDVDFSNGVLNFVNGSLGAGSLSLAGSTLVWAAGNTEDITTRTVTLGGGNVNLNTNGNDVVLAGDLGNSGAANFSKIGEGSLTFAGTPSYTGTTTVSEGTLQLGNGGITGFVGGGITNNARLVANFADGEFLENAISGTGSFVHAGEGLLELVSANTFAGSTSISSETGVLQIASELGLQNSTLDYSALGGSLSFGTLFGATLGGLSGDKDLSLQNATEGAVALRIGNNNEIADYSGALTGAGSLVKIGTNIQYLSGLSTYTGATTVSAGNLILEDGSIEGAALTVNGSGRMVVTGGLFGATTGTLAVNSGGLLVSEGTTTFSGAVVANGSTGNSASALIRVEGGVLSAPSINLGRTFENALAEPAGATADRNLYMTGGAVNVTNLELGTTTASNSTVVTRVDGGVLTVGGLLTVGINNTGRWSVLDINGGELVCNAPDASVVLGAPTFAGSSLFVVRGGTANVERVQFGQATYGGAGVVKLTAGDLYVGAGGLDIGTSAAGYVSTLKLSGGTLGATADWSSDAAIGIQIPFGATAVIQAGDVFDVAHDITLNGVISGEGSLVKSGSGTLTLNGANTYLGSTEVSAGTLSLTTKSLNDEAAVLVSAGSTLNLAFSGSDMVAELVLDGVTQTNGIYGKVGSGGGVIGSPFITGDGLLAVGVVAEPVSPYATWAAANGLSVGVNDGFEQDPDLDGIANSLEFALGGNPLASSTAVLPQLSLTADNFVFSFNRRDESEAEVALNFSWGSALVTWANEVAIGASSAAADASGVVVTVTEGAGEGDPDAITVSVPRSNAVAGKLFGRLGATQQP
ncbi:MAG: hypothetical protein RLZZ245_2536 [Verrucomicrobiota bacterium]